jgi:urease accessory protein
METSCRSGGQELNVVSVNGSSSNGRPFPPADVGSGGLGAFLASLQLSDSFFPSGLFTLSHGIESFAQAGLLTPETLAGIVADLVCCSAGPSDATALALAIRAARDEDLKTVAAVDRRLTAVKITREPRETSIRLGRQLLALANEVFACELARRYLLLLGRESLPGNHAIALALLKASLGIPAPEAVAGELYSFAASCVGAAVRMSEIDHRNAQRILLLLHPVIEAATSDALSRSMLEMGGSTPMAELMSMRHETAELRLFSS